MSIAELYETGEQKQHKGHFRNLVMVAKADGVIDENEMALLKKIARQIGISISVLITSVGETFGRPRQLYQ